MAGDDLQSKATDLVKKILTVGVGAIFLTEEGLRSLISEFKLPKELIGGVLESANKTRKEFLKNLSDDTITRLMEKVDPKQMLQELLERNEIEFDIKMRFKPKNSGE